MKTIWTAAVGKFLNQMHGNTNGTLFVHVFEVTAAIRLETQIGAISVLLMADIPRSSFSTLSPPSTISLADFFYFLYFPKKLEKMKG